MEKARRARKDLSNSTSIFALYFGKMNANFGADTVNPSDLDPS